MQGSDAGSSTGPARSWWANEGVRWMIVTLLIPFAGFVWNEVQKQEVDRQKQLERVRADEQTRVANARSESDIIIKLLPALAVADDASPSRGIALAVLLNLANRQALSPELVGSVQVAVDTAQQRLRDGKATEAERVALSKIASATDQVYGRGTAVWTTPVAGNASASTSPGPTVSQAFRVQVPRVYIQIFDEADRDRARALQDWIVTTKRWLAPGIENVVATATRASKKPPDGTNTWRVLYFNDDDGERAKELVAFMRASGLSALEVQRSRLKAPPGQLEIWSPKPSG